jgi:hypothetical protein
MRQYVVDELRPQEREKIREYLDKHCKRSDLGGLYWIELPEDILTTKQREHEECWPHCTAVEVCERSVNFEMLVRSRRKVRCNCVAFATPEQRAFVLAFADRLLEETGIPV